MFDAGTVDAVSDCVFHSNGVFTQRGRGRSIHLNNQSINRITDCPPLFRLTVEEVFMFLKLTLKTHRGRRKARLFQLGLCLTG